MLIIFSEAAGANSYASAYNVLGSTVPAGQKIPLAVLSGSLKDVSLANNELTVSRDGVYAVFCAVRASTPTIGGYVSLMSDDAFFPNTTMIIATSQQSYSMMATIDLMKGQSIYLQAQYNSITLPTGTNANITMRRIDDLR